MRNLWLVSVLVLAGCGDAGADTATVDAGADAAADTGADTGGDAGLTDPAPPVLTPCAPGWREVMDPSGIVLCDPWHATGREVCADRAYHLPGTPGCVPVGSACPADGWPPAVFGSVFVDAAAGAGGDGMTRASAFRTVHDAVAAAADGGTIIVRAGAYDETSVPGLVATGALTIVGACASGTTIMLSTGASSSGLRFGTDGTLRAATVEGAPVFGGTASTTIEGVVARDIFVESGDLRAVDSRIGVVLGGSARGMLYRVEVREDSGLQALDDASLLLTDSVVLAAALSGMTTASVALVRTVLENAWISGDFGMLTLTDCLVHGPDASTKSRESPIELARTRIAGTKTFGIYTGGPLSLTDVVVHDIGLDGAGGGQGIVAAGRATLLRVAALRTRIVGVYAFNGGVITATDLRVDGVTANCPGSLCKGPALGGFGIAAAATGIGTFTRFSVRGAELCGVVVDLGGMLDLSTGWVDATPIGACVQIPGYDATRLARDVQYRTGVTVPLQATSYVVPPPP